MVLALVEALLRLVGIGCLTDFFVPASVENEAVLVDNQAFGKRFFPAELVRYPHPFLIPVHKTSRDLRVFVLGESAAMGDPDAKFGLPRMLEVLLQGRFPDRNVQVVNAAMVAINSHVILPIARDCAKREGDLWVIYMGNNEVIGPFGAITPFGRAGAPLALVRANIAAKRLRLVQGLDRILQLATRRHGAPVAWEGMAMWGDQQVRADDPAIVQLRRSFRRNLQDILEIAREAKVPVLLCTVATNVKDCAPFGSLHSPELGADRLSSLKSAFDQGVTAAAQRDFAQARTAFQRALDLDPTHAETQFRLAECCAKLDQWKEAAELFLGARDHDTLQFRCDRALNGIIRDCASIQTNDVSLLDAEALFAAHSPNGLPGRELFYEHVHFNPAGNYLLARAVAERAEQVLSSRRGEMARTSAPAWLSEPECFEKVGLTDWNRYDILFRLISERVELPPFTRQANHVAHLAYLRAELEVYRAAAKPVQLQRAARKVSAAIEARPKDVDLHWNLAQLLDLNEDFPKAEEQWRIVTKSWPQAWLPYYNLGKLLEHHGQLVAARTAYEKCLRLAPEYFEAQYALGVILMRLELPREALPHLKIAVSRNPSAPQVYLALGAAWERLHEWNAAMQQYQAVLQLDPNNAAALAAVKRLNPN